MKNLFIFPAIIFLTIVTLLPKQSNAQYFAPVGAKWTYEYAPGIFSPPPYTVEPLTLEVVKDTIINGLSCRKVEIAISNNVQGYKYIRSANDSVTVYSLVNNKFNLLYNFNVSVGDTMEIFSDEPWFSGFLDSSLVQIDSVGTKIIKGINYRAYHQTYVSGAYLEGGYGWVIDSLGVIEPYYAYYYYGYPYIDRISYLFLAPSIGGPPNIYPLRCYTDSNTYYNYDNTNCDTSYIITGVNDISSTKINIYPTLIENNNRTITIETTNGFPEQIKLFSLTGLSIPTKIERQETKTELILSKDIPSGVYLLKFALDNEVFTHKILIL